MRSFFFSLPLLILTAACEWTGQDAIAPPEDTRVGAQARREAMVAAAHPAAVDAGLEALANGGDAVDAAIAVQMVLGLVEPQSSGIGGGAFMVRFDASEQSLIVYDGRETAPAAATETLFLNEEGEPLSFVEAWQSGRSTGVPGVIAMLHMAHREHGTRDWAANFDDAITLAEEGFAVPPRLHQSLARVAEYTALDEREPSASLFYDAEGEPWPVGTVLTNPRYGSTLRAVAEDWRRFYTGSIAADIVETAREEPLPSPMTVEDIETYEPVRREAICTPYRAYRICSAPPPSSGAVAVGGIMAMLENFDLAEFGPDTAQGWHYFIEASRLAYADRDRYVGDPAYADVPTAGLLDEDYLNERAGLIQAETALEAVSAGTPPGAADTPEDATEDAPGTSHFVIVDADGDVVSMTTTVESAFGNNRMTAHGFMLNNELTDFAFVPRDEDGDLRPNAPAGGKRPRSSMSPAIVLDEAGNFVLATGSPGGNSIIAYTAKSLVAMLDWGLSPDQAASLPNVVARGQKARVETGFDEGLIDELREMGHELETGQSLTSGLHIVRATGDGYAGAADPRRDGVAIGLSEAALSGKE